MSKQVTRPAVARKARTASFAPPVKVYALLPGMRPKSGERLFAHTAAALEVLGITRTHSAPALRLAALIGPTAYKWHTVTLGTLEPVGENVRLTKVGQETFSARERDGLAPRHLIDAFKAVFSTGRASVQAQVYQHHISTATT